MGGAGGGNRGEEGRERGGGEGEDGRGRERDRQTDRQTEKGRHQILIFFFDRLPELNMDERGIKVAGRP
jgi:hypothetical protein